MAGRHPAGSLSGRAVVRRRAIGMRQQASLRVTYRNITVLTIELDIFICKYCDAAADHPFRVVRSNFNVVFYCFCAAAPTSGRAGCQARRAYRVQGL
jgi:hypothetical protein